MAAQFQDALLRVLAVAPGLAVMALVATAANLLTGCAHPVPVRYAPPSVAATASALQATRSALAGGQQAIAKAKEDARALDAAIPAALRPQFDLLTNDLSTASQYVEGAASNAAVTETNLAGYTTAVTNQTATLNQTTEQLDYLRPKYEKAVGLIWKWRLYFLGLAGGLIVYLVLKYGSRLAATAATVAAKIP